ncbi:MAG: hypothetical protein KJ798_01915 [Gammaproteobacteria bacterium]|uniref:hypothetical protein n=1 Tax=Limnobacter sp. TaxID=2003368 RepID=UPI001D74F4D4|nr:hypothetical protein [Limnobacter sp.]MBU0784177.1 hypothetical protein [Gammaproteobacteria bacterium]MBU0848220.1 hypothetical protein [Gammaproteobacteria bacterium]MBU1266914.1 hypothetical protein [Gammaproteobacteria bacterium]MBU1528427.1 hypothetical protein [Gammaproteobacteria bacterium]MBU1779116.1 hypothetical protein [Gammaproteobacteria bacterium]
MAIVETFSIISSSIAFQSLEMRGGFAPRHLQKFIKLKQKKDRANFVKECEGSGIILS